MTTPTADHALEALNRDANERTRVERLDRWERGPTTIERFRLGNGLEVIVWEDHAAPVFAFQTWFRVGSRHEPKGRTGIAHLFEHMMFKATANHPEGEFDTLMEARGAQTNAATWVDWTYYREKLPSGNLELVCDLEADRMANLRLDTEQLESEREVVKNERKMRVDNDPEGKLYEALYALAYREHGYGHPTIGWMADIEALTLDDCLDFYRCYYAPNNATIVVVGDVDTATLLGLVQRYYGALEAQDIPPEDVRVEPPQRQARRDTLTLALAAPKAVYAYHAPAAADPAFGALEVLVEILAGGESSRLYRELVTEREVATECGAWTSSWAQPGLLEIAVTLRPGRSIEEAEAIIDAEIARVTDELVTARELTKAVNVLEASELRGASDTGRRARRLGHAHTSVGDYRWCFRHQDALREVTAADVRAVARRVLRPDNRTTLVGQPPEAS